MNIKYTPGQNRHLPNRRHIFQLYNLKQWLTISLLLCFSLLFSHTGMADVLLIDSVQSAHARGLPRTGQTMDEVRSEWGTPESEYSAVGSPPITRWVFDDFSVYFEYDHVISSVIHEGVALRSKH